MPIGQEIPSQLSEVSKLLLLNKIESIAITYVKSDGDIVSIYDLDDNANRFTLLGALESLKTRYMHQGIEMGLYNEDDD